jgi:hypothetical protein
LAALTPPPATGAGSRPPPPGPPGGRVTPRLIRAVLSTLRARAEPTLGAAHAAPVVVRYNSYRYPSCQRA